MKAIQYIPLVLLMSLACSLTTPPSAPIPQTARINKSPIAQTAVPTQTPTTCLVSAHVLQLRECGALRCTVKDWLPQGELLYVQHNVNGWLQVITPNATSGWVNSKYCGGK